MERERDTVPVDERIARLAEKQHGVVARGQRHERGEHPCHAADDRRSQAPRRCRRAPLPSLRPHDVKRPGAIPVTSVARTLLDVAGMLRPGPLARAVEQALVLRLFDLAAVHDLLAVTPNRRGAATLGEIVARIDDEPALTRSRARDARLTVAGYRVVRFTYRQLVRDSAAVAAIVRRLLRPAYAASSSSSRPERSASAVSW